MNLKQNKHGTTNTHPSLTVKTKKKKKKSWKQPKKTDMVYTRK